MSIAGKSLKEFIHTAKCGDLDNKQGRDRWHRLARRVVRVLAEHMGLERPEYDMRTDRGNKLFPGTTVLHAHGIYIKFVISSFSRDIGFMYRRCETRKDFTGENNHYMKWESLLNMKDTAQHLLQHARGD